MTAKSVDAPQGLRPGARDPTFYASASKSKNEMEQFIHKRFCLNYKSYLLRIILKLEQNFILLYSHGIKLIMGKRCVLQMLM